MQTQLQSFYAALINVYMYVCRIVLFTDNDNVVELLAESD